MMSDGPSVLSLRAWDVHDDYSRCGNSVLGVIQVLMGLLSMALGVGAICTWASGYYIGYGIWCGFMITVAGGIQIGAARHKNTCLIVSTMTLSILGAILGVIQMSLGIVAADNDAIKSRNDVIVGTGIDPAWDIYFAKNHPYTYICVGDSDINWAKSWGPVDILLLIAGFIEAVTGTISAILCCQSVCCGMRKISMARGIYYQGNTGTTGFSNDGYMTESRMSPSPPLYKVV